MANNRELTKLFERAEFLRDYLGKQYIKLQSEYDSLEKKVGVYFNENSEYKSTNHKLRQELQEIQQLYKSTQSKLDELLKAECNNCTSMRDRLVAATDTIDEFNHKERGYRREIDRLGLLIEKAAEDLSEMTQKYELTKTTIERDDIIQISNDVIRQVLGDKKIAVLAESFLLPKFSAILPNIRGYTPEELKATKMLSEAFDLIITMTGFTNHAASNKSKREAAIRGIPEVRYGGRDVRTCLTLACNVICKK